VFFRNTFKFKLWYIFFDDQKKFSNYYQCDNRENYIHSILKLENLFL
jgi:hypothetical protein